MKKYSFNFHDVIWVFRPEVSKGSMFDSLEQNKPYSIFSEEGVFTSHSFKSIQNEMIRLTGEYIDKEVKKVYPDKDKKFIELAIAIERAKLLNSLEELR